MGTTETQESTETKLRRIAWLSKQDPQKEFCNLMHHFNEESLRSCYHELAGNKAVGVDGVNKEEYGRHLNENLKDLTLRMKQMSYRPGTIRQVLIPKEGKKDAYRSLGISNFEDKLVQKMMQKVLESIYEPIFLQSSYGFRPGRGCHDAIRALHKHLFSKPVEIVIDVDLANFFCSIDHKELEQILRIKIKDTRLLRYIIRMFKAGILSKGEIIVSEEGVAQGNCASPVFANIFAHYAIDVWMETTVKQHCRGEIRLFRYGDDLCICCEKESDAKRVQAALAKRLAKFKLKMNEAKTKLVKFTRQNKGKAAFQFLGFRFYWGRSQKGLWIPKIKTDGKRMRSKLKKMEEWIKENRNKHRLKVLWKELCTKIEGHIQYYGISFNLETVGTFILHSKQIMFKWLNRRSQRKSFDWQKFELFIRANPLPCPKVRHKLF
jgi:group II intron reverse transcriptase/maturase